jgi:hypothetical protein
MATFLRLAHFFDDRGSMRRLESDPTKLLEALAESFAFSAPVSEPGEINTNCGWSRPARGVLAGLPYDPGV